MNSTRVFVLALFGAAMAAAQNATPVPKITGPVPVTADSAPFIASNRSITVMDLSKAGYVEEEFIVNGTANIYDWAADGALSVKTPNVPYGTRILVRRPADPSRFSGTVVAELLNPARRFDWAMMWGFSREYFLEHGDAWVGITLPGSSQGLKKFNASRYSAISFPNPTPGGCPNASADVEDGLRWDMMSQVAAALKSDATPRPMGGLKVERIFMTTQGGDIITYINAIHAHARLAGGKPAYDGYFVKNPAGAARINQCAPAPAKDDPRRNLGNADVPVVGVVAQGELMDSLPARKPDSDDPAGRYRLYEIAGVAHIDKNAYMFFPTVADQNAAVGAAQGTPSWPFNARCEPEIPLSDHPGLKYAYNAAWWNLDQWVKTGKPAPHAERLQVKDGALVTDKFGNGVGGVRSPYVDVPVATYYTSSNGPGTCRELGHTAAFDWAQLETLYGSYKSYAAKLSQSVDQLVKDHWLTESDGKKIKSEIVTPK